MPPVSVGLRFSGTAKSAPARNGAATVREWCVSYAWTALEEYAPSSPPVWTHGSWPIAPEERKNVAHGASHGSAWQQNKAPELGESRWRNIALAPSRGSALSPQAPQITPWATIFSPPGSRATCPGALSVWTHTGWPMAFFVRIAMLKLPRSNRAESHAGN
jgi:hypothetical protein